MRVKTCKKFRLENSHCCWCQDLTAVIVTGHHDISQSSLQILSTYNNNHSYPRLNRWVWVGMEPSLRIYLGQCVCLFWPSCGQVAQCVPVRIFSRLRQNSKLEVFLQGKKVSTDKTLSTDVKMGTLKAIMYFWQFKKKKKKHTTQPPPPLLSSVFSSSENAGKDWQFQLN